MAQIILADRENLRRLARRKKPDLVPGELATGGFRVVQQAALKLFNALIPGNSITLPAAGFESRIRSHLTEYKRYDLKVP